MCKPSTPPERNATARRGAHRGAGRRTATGFDFRGRTRHPRRPNSTTMHARCASLRPASGRPYPRSLSWLHRERRQAGNKRRETRRGRMLRHTAVPAPNRVRGRTACGSSMSNVSRRVGKSHSSHITLADNTRRRPSIAKSKSWMSIGPSPPFRSGQRALSSTAPNTPPRNLLLSKAIAGRVKEASRAV